MVLHGILMLFAGVVWDSSTSMPQGNENCSLSMLDPIENSKKNN